MPSVLTVVPFLVLFTAACSGEPQAVEPAPGQAQSQEADVPLASQPPPPEQSGQAKSDETARIARGVEVYREQKCQACHSIANVGNRRNPLDGVGTKLSEEEIRTWIVAPREMNPKVTKRAYDKLPAADLDALVAYMKSLRRE
jgi:mono/diheme cytochrome c family protein